ncbi:glycosyltransferase family 2 protein [Pedobacter duraquae]|uniref:Glycosyltransferase 2-like domain-containing protein n=1 Tax=Pedobacter duraquae TaxID=425511 RepID=A0A4R6IFQ6_9SPHI|nr:glycosyltransferase family 2 protein [Pedobacter duraquae]TDO20626.1 hypothetical protein CLV32_3259 [Pedobacter duraquae]
MNNNHPSVAVVILNWNGRELLKTFLPQVIQSKYPNLKIVVGDNGSTDDSVEFVKREFPTIEVIENRLNLGFAGGYNEVLLQVDADYFVLLNSDVSVPENWIQPVIDLMESDDLIAAAQPKIKWYQDQQQFEYAGAAGGFLDRFGFPFCRGRIFNVIETDHGQYDDNCEIFWASGAALFIKRKCWFEVSGLDADFFAHMEEIDICWRLKNLGYKIMYCHEAEVYHVGGATLNTENPHKTFLNFRNNLYILQKNLPENELLSLLFCRIWIDFVAWIHFLLTGKPKFAWAVSKAHFEFFRNLTKTSRKRKDKQMPFNELTGVYHSSVVWAFFVIGYRKFSQLF